MVECPGKYALIYIIKRVRVAILIKELSPQAPEPFLISIRVFLCARMKGTCGLFPIAQLAVEISQETGGIERIFTRIEHVGNG